MPYGLKYLNNIDKILGTGTSKKVMTVCTACHEKTNQQAFTAYLGGVCPACEEAKLIIFDGNMWKQNNELH